MSLTNVGGFNDTMWSTQNFISPTGIIQLGAAPGSTGAINIDNTSYTTSIAIYSSSTLVGNIGYPVGIGTLAIYGATGKYLYLGANNIAKWQILPDAAGTATLVSAEIIARIVGGSSNGLAIRNSANTNDNFLVSDAGTIVTLSTGTVGIQVPIISAASGEIQAGGYLRSITAGQWVGLRSVSAATGGILGLYYNNTDALSRSAFEISNVTGAGVFGILSQMKSGGIVAIGNNSTGTADNLTIAGSAYGAGVASLRLNGLTDAAGANVGTLTNCPHTGNPSFWAPISIAGTVYAIPCYALT